MLTALLAAACGASGSLPAGSSMPTPAPGAIEVVTSTTVFGDMVQRVGGSHVSVTSLVPRGGDVHTYEPRPAEVESLGRARLVVMNGLGLDDWLDKLVTTSSGGSTKVVRLAADLPGAAYLAGQTPGTTNPHLWLDVAYAIGYAERIRDALVAVDPAHAADYTANAAAYVTELRSLDGWIRDQIGRIPEADRKLISFHDAFPYFARAYGVDIVGTVVHSPGQDPSASQVAALVDAIRKAGVRVVFTEAQFSPRLVQVIADETGAKVVGNLYDDTLGDPPVDSYAGVMRWDVTQLVDALR